ncbi:MAG: hypothetical protein DRO11_05820, partial [Methanobacteriota archaeon]
EFPVIQETYREILCDTMDIQQAARVVEDLRRGKLRPLVIETEVPSPLAHNLIVLGEPDVVLMENRKKRLLELHEAIMKRIENQVGEEVEPRAQACAADGQNQCG